MGIILRQYLKVRKPDKDGLCPIAISIRGGGKELFYFTGIKVHPDHYKDGQITKAAKHYDLNNAKLKKLISETERTILNREIDGEQMTVEQVKNLLSPGIGSNFYTYAESVIAAKDKATKRRYTIELDKLKEYAGNALHFGQITPMWLSAYYKYLTTAKGEKRANSHNTAINAFKVIRHVFNEAKENKITTLYPFKDWKYPQYKAPKKSYLTQEYIDKIFKILDDDHSEVIKLVSAYFLLEVFSGIRVSDWHKFSIEKIVNNEDLIFTTTKTGTDVRIPVDIMPSLNRVVSYIKENKLKYPYKDSEFANEKLETIQEIIKYKGGKLTTHLARHTCASMWLNHGMSKQAIGALLGITEKQVNTYAHLSGNILRNEVTRLGGL